MFTSQLLEKLNTDKNFDWKHVSEDLPDELLREAQFLSDIINGIVRTSIRSAGQLVITYPDGHDALIFYRPNTDDYIIYSGETSVIASREICGDFSALVSNGETCFVLPNNIMEAALE